MKEKLSVIMGMAGFVLLATEASTMDAQLKCLVLGALLICAAALVYLAPVKERRKARRKGGEHGTRYRACRTKDKRTPGHTEAPVRENGGQGLGAWYQAQ